MSLEEDPFAPLTEVEAATASAPKPRAEKVPILPVPDDAPELSFKHPQFGVPVKAWPYRDAAGALLGYDARFEHFVGGKLVKEVLPLTYCQIGERRGWRSKAMPSPRPLYGLNRLAEKPQAPVLIVEGCKTADAAELLLPEFVATSWQGGGNAVHLTDWQPLAGRDVLIWPDRDRHTYPDGSEKPYAEQAGTLTAQRIAQLLQGVPKKIAVLDVTDGGEKDGWDAADAFEDGWDAADALAFISANRCDPKPRPVIRVQAGKLHLMASEAESALIAAGAPFYVRGGIARPVLDEAQASHGRVTKVARLAQVDVPTLVDHLSRHADWVKFNARSESFVPTDPPLAVAATILSRDGEWKFPKLAAVLTTQTIRPDGSLLSAAGFDPATRLLLLSPPALPPISDAPSKAEAVEALNTLDRLLDGFPFVDDASRSVALSGIISPVVRGGVPTCPLHAAGAPVAGSGKSFLWDVASAVFTGDRSPVIAVGRTEEETEKRLTSALLNGQPIVSIDNVNGELGGDFLCQMIERPVVAVRVLGLSKLVKIESRATTYATGNNIRLVGDMTRRVILCSLDPNVERPELRTFRFNPFEAVIADRGKYVAAVLTVVRAYICAGYPGVLPPLASFEQWSNLVRSALVWLGKADPCDTMEAARSEDPITSSLRAVLTAWHDAVSSQAVTTGKIKQQATIEGPHGGRVHHELEEALIDVAEARIGGIDAKRLGHFLSRHQGRIINGLKLTSMEDSHSKQKLWRVSRVD